MQNPILLSNNILRLRILISIYFYYEIITINTLNFSLRTLFSSIQLLQSQIYSTYIYKLPRNYPLIPSYPVQPSYPAESSDLRG